jgi:hypothetical protein
MESMSSRVIDFRNTLHNEGHSIEDIRKELLAEYARDHIAKNTKESVFPPILDNDSAYHHKEFIEKFILPNIKLQYNCATIDGDTQTSGRKLEDATEHALKINNMKYVRAGSQQPIDIQNAIPNGSWPWGAFFFECKKTNGNTIVLNDSIPKPGTWYIIYCVKTREVTVILADILVKNNRDKLIKFKRIIECLRHDFKKIGDYNSVARMTLSINIRQYIESKQRIFWNIHKDPPPLLNLKEEKEIGEYLTNMFRSSF